MGLAVGGWCNDRGESPYNGGGTGSTRLDPIYGTKLAAAPAEALGFETDTQESTYGPFGVEIRDRDMHHALHVGLHLMTYFVSKNYIFRNYANWPVLKDDFLQLFLLQKRNLHARILVAEEETICNGCCQGSRNAWDSMR